MILMTDLRNRQLVYKLVHYIRGGKVSTAEMPADYYNRQRMNLIGKRLQNLFSHDVPERDLSLVDIEVFYIRWCEGEICRQAALADWKGLLEQIARRLTFYVNHSDTILSRHVTAIHRLWLIVQALKPR
jgi:hypothetical protein